MNNKYINAFNSIKKAEKILLVTHVRPDGDALASICGIIELLEQFNKPYTAYCRDKPPYQFDFLPHLEKITSDKTTFNFFNFDLIIVLDCGSLNRTALENEINNKSAHQCIIEFDHHPKIDDYADLELRNPKAAATTELLYYLLMANQIRINKNMASCILTGIATDTAFFLHSTTSNKTIDIASEMLKYGAHFPQIIENTWRNKSLGAMKIWGTAINNLVINKNYNLAFSVLTLKDITESTITQEELEGMAGFLCSLHGVKGLMLLREEKNRLIKGSLRSNHPEIDISLLAQVLGGGGHSKASGFSVESSLQKTNNGWRVV